MIYLKKSIKEFYGYDCVIKTKISFTNDILASSRTRYEASKILNKYNSNQNVLIITEKDIAYRKSSQFPEWGIFGLGLRPGKTCVISTFRLKKKVTNQKIIEHIKKDILWLFLNHFFQYIVLFQNITHLTSFHSAYQHNSNHGQ